MMSLLNLADAAPAAADGAEDQPPPSLATTLEQWRDARFGLFIHWGLYSLAGGEWKGSTVATGGPWKGKGFTEFLQLQAQIPIAEYEDFARGFRPAAFDADQWVRDAKAAGMRYLVFTAKHHEGFAMYRSPSHCFNIVDHSGFPTDPVAELAATCRRHGLLFGVYYSLGRDWHDPDAPTDWPTKGGRSNTWDYPDEDAKVFDRYFRRKVLPQVRELMTQYGPIDMLWFDTPERITAAQSTELREMVRAVQPACVVNDRVGNALGDYTTYEQKVPPGPVAIPWETCATLGRNWSFLPRDTQWKTPEEIVRLLTDVVAKDGNLLFNVSPRGDGSWPEGAAAHLKQVGEWLSVNGPAIYGARAWTTHAEAAEGQAEPAAVAPSGTPATQDTVRNEITHQVVPDLRFTVAADGALNVIARSWNDDTVRVRALGLGRPEAPRVRAARLLGSDDAVTWTQTDDALVLHFPPRRPDGVPVWVFRLETSR
jgi:alpha-L-fucosidase